MYLSTDISTLQFGHGLMYTELLLHVVIRHLCQRFSTFFILWTQQTFQARVADPHRTRRPDLNFSYLRLGQNMSLSLRMQLLKFC